MVRCGNCAWARNISKELRLTLSQENKEIINTLERRRFNLGEFCYCEKLGFIESQIMKRDCEAYMES